MSRNHNTFLVELAQRTVQMRVHWQPCGFPLGVEPALRNFEHYRAQIMPNKWAFVCIGKHETQVFLSANIFGDVLYHVSDNERGDCPAYWLGVAVRENAPTLQNLLDKPWIDGVRFNYEAD